MTSLIKSFQTKLSSFQRASPRLYGLVDLLVNIAIIILLVLGIRTYLISPFQVYGPSMCDTLNYINGECKHRFGEYLIVNRAVYFPFFDTYRYRLPIRGDIVVFKPPNNQEEYYIKRVIGLPGEKVKIQNGKVYLMNTDHTAWWELPEPYLNDKNKGRTYPLVAYSTTEYVVPEGQYFVLGDNRLESTDSRHCFHTRSTSQCAEKSEHFLPLDRVEGKASLVLWPFNKVRALPNPSYEDLAAK